MVTAFGSANSIADGFDPVNLEQKVFGSACEIRGRFKRGSWRHGGGDNGGWLSKTREEVGSHFLISHHGECNEGYGENENESGLGESDPEPGVRENPLESSHQPRVLVNFSGFWIEQERAQNRNDGERNDERGRHANDGGDGDGGKKFALYSRKSQKRNEDEDDENGRIEDGRTDFR